MAGRSSKDVALRRYGDALDKVSAAEGKVRFAEAEANLSAQRFILHGGTDAELDAVRREKGFGTTDDGE